jgi:glycosyltransferase involved in cell wall biosynthesis
LVLLDRELRARLSMHALQKAQTYTWQAVAEHMLSLYEELWLQKISQEA